MVVSVVVVGALICGALIHSVWDLKSTQMNVKRSLIREYVLYEFELDYNSAKAFVMRKVNVQLITVQ